VTIRRRTALVPCFLGASLGLAACGGGGRASEPASAAAPAPAGERVAWSAMDRDTRLSYMGLVVLPTMKDAFQGHDAAAFGGFRCQACHGDGFDKPPIDFRMPNPTLPPLSAADPVGSGKALDPATAQFMIDTVVPTMARLLDEEPYNPATGKGFGCFRCHPTAGETP
jgi:hypothetical protein